MSTTSPPADPVGAVRRLHRSREDRILGGVCSGVARYFNIDPTIVRIAAAALLLLGGVGVIAYLAAWLLVPEEGTDAPILRTGIPVEHGRVRMIAGGVLLAVAVLVIAGGLIPDLSHDLIAPVFLGLAGMLLLVGPRWIGDGGPEAAKAPAASSTPGTPTGTGPENDPEDRDDKGDVRDETDADIAQGTPAPGTGTDVVLTPATAVTRVVPPASPAVPDATTREQPTAPSGFVTPAYGMGGGRPGLPGAAPTTRMGPVPSRPLPRQPRKPRSPVGFVALGALLIAGAAMAGVVAIDPNGIPWDETLAIFVIGMGAILAVAGLFGRARLAILTAFSVTAVAALLVGLNLHLTGGVGNRSYVPTGTAPAAHYELGVGQLRIDVRKAKLSGKVPTRIHAELGVGRMVVIVPAGVRLTVNAEQRAGNMELGTQFSNGTDLERSVTVGPAKGPQIVLDADLGIGSLEVRRGDPPWPTSREDDGALVTPTTTGRHPAHA